MRDPVKWYNSVKNSIYKLNKTATHFPCSWFLRLINSYDGVELAKQICYTVPQGSALGLSMFEAIENGEETAVKFWKDHVEEVKRVVPEEKLLIFEVMRLTHNLFQYYQCNIEFQGQGRLGSTLQISRGCNSFCSFS